VDVVFLGRCINNKKLVLMNNHMERNVPTTPRWLRFLRAGVPPGERWTLVLRRTGVFPELIICFVNKK